MFDLVEAGSADAGELLALGANAPLSLDDPTLAWIVEAGEAAVFAVELDGTAPLGPRHYVFSARPGEEEAAGRAAIAQDGARPARSPTHATSAAAGEAVALRA